MFSLFVAAGATYLVIHLSFLAGALNERKNRVCVGVQEASKYEQNVKMVEGVCTELYKYKNDDFKACEQEREHWRDSYYYLKSQQQAATSTN